jgi:hypothetical protein
LTVAPAPADLVDAAGARVEGVLVEGEKEHRGVVVEQVLGAVAVVDVPVDDHHPLDPVPALQVARRHRDVVEQAEAHRPVGLGVVTGRAHAGEPVVDLAGHDRVNQGEHPAGGQAGGVMGGRRHPGVGVEREALVVRARRHLAQVGRVVHEGEVRGGGSPRLEAHQPAAVAAFEGGAQGGEARRPLGVARPRVVGLEALVDDDAGAQHRAPRAQWTRPGEKLPSCSSRPWRRTKW